MRKKANNLAKIKSRQTDRLAGTSASASASIYTLTHKHTNSHTHKQTHLHKHSFRRTLEHGHTHMAELCKCMRLIKYSRKKSTYFYRLIWDWDWDDDLWHVKIWFGCDIIIYVILNTILQVFKEAYMPPYDKCGIKYQLSVVYIKHQIWYIWHIL